MRDFLEIALATAISVLVGTYLIGGTVMFQIFMALLSYHFLMLLFALAEIIADKAKDK